MNAKMFNIVDNIEKIRQKKNIRKRDLIKQIREIMYSQGLTPPAEKTLYAKLGKDRSLENELIPFFAQVLNVPEQDLFDPSKKEKIALEEFMAHPQKYQEYIPDRYEQLPKNIQEIVENLLYLGEEEIELYYTEIKAKALRKREIEKDVKID